MPSPTPYRQIRAKYDSDTITVYQAYKESIATAAVAEQKLNASPDFRPGRMTWIKPSWSWMMYRAGYSHKDPGQARILALKARHEDFVGLLARGVLTAAHGPSSTEGAAREKRDKTRAKNSGEPGRGQREKPRDVKIQWDPERTPKLEALPYRSIQIGIPGALSEAWAKEWVVEIEDVTEAARELKRVVEERPEITTEELVQLGLVPDEKPFVVPQSVQSRLEMTPLNGPDE